MKLEITGIEGSRDHIIDDVNGVIFMANVKDVNEDGDSAINAGIVGKFSPISILLSIHNILKQDDIKDVLTSARFIQQFIDFHEDKTGTTPHLTLEEIDMMIKTQQTLENIFGCLDSEEVREKECTCDNCTCEKEAVEEDLLDKALEGKSRQELDALIAMGRMLFGSGALND